MWGKDKRERKNKSEVKENVLQERSMTLLSRGRVPGGVSDDLTEVPVDTYIYDQQKFRNVFQSSTRHTHGTLENEVGNVDRGEKDHVVEGGELGSDDLRDPERDNQTSDGKEEEPLGQCVAEENQSGEFT